jgi:hypothetical protein
MLPDIQLRSYPYPTKVSKYINKFIFSPIILHRWPVPVRARFTAQVCSRSPAVIVGLNRLGHGCRLQVLCVVR